jgi:hypothetical protein
VEGTTMTTLPRAEVLRVLRRAGLPQAAEALAPVLPELVDLDRDIGIFLRHGVEEDVLVDRMGGSP